MAWRFQVSKFKNATPKQAKREDTIFDAPVGQTFTGNGIAASASLIVFSYESEGAKLCLLPISAQGRKQRSDLSLIYAHAGELSDCQFCPFYDTLLATSARGDCQVKLWVLDGQSSATRTYTEPTAVLDEHSDQVQCVRFHPNVAQILSTAAEYRCSIWDVSTHKRVLDMHESDDKLCDTSWHGAGHLITTLDKSASARVYDPRSSVRAVQSFQASEGQCREAQILCLGQENKILTSGFAKNRCREVLLFDMRSVSTPIKTLTLDSSTGVMMPFYDCDTRLVFLAGKGSSKISLHELTDREPFLPEGLYYTCEAPILGMCLVPKLAMSVMEGEVARALVLNKSGVIPVSYNVPRRTYRDFHADLYPDTVGYQSGTTAMHWLKGSNVAPVKFSLDPAKRAMMPEPGKPLAHSENKAQVSPPIDRNANQTNGIVQPAVEPHVMPKTDAHSPVEPPKPSVNGPVPASTNHAEKVSSPTSPPWRTTATAAFSSPVAKQPIEASKSEESSPEQPNSPKQPISSIKAMTAAFEKAGEEGMGDSPRSYIGSQANSSEASRREDSSSGTPESPRQPASSIKAMTAAFEKANEEAAGDSARPHSFMGSQSYGLAASRLGAGGERNDLTATTTAPAPVLNQQITTTTATATMPAGSVEKTLPPKPVVPSAPQNTVAAGDAVSSSLSKSASKAASDFAPKPNVVLNAVSSGGTVSSSFPKAASKAPSDSPSHVVNGTSHKEESKLDKAGPVSNGPALIGYREDLETVKLRSNQPNSIGGGAKPNVTPQNDFVNRVATEANQSNRRSQMQRPQSNIFGKRTSKYRHTLGTLGGKIHKYINIRDVNTRLAVEGTGIAVSSKWIASSVSGTSGCILILDVNESGKIPDGVLTGLENCVQICDLQWSPFDDSQLCVACLDGSLKIWQIPEEGVKEPIREPAKCIAAHKDKITMIRYHPTAQDVLISAGNDGSLIVWDLNQGSANIELDADSQQVLSLCWSIDGQSLVVVSRDEMLRFYDPRKSTSPLRSCKALESTRGARVSFACYEELILVSCFGKSSERTLKLFRVSDLSQVTSVKIDSSPQLLVPFCDYDSSVVFLTGKGDRSIHIYEVIEEPPYLLECSKFTAPSAHQAVAFQPKRCCNVRNVEFAKAWRLTLQDIELLTFSVPRKRMDCFQNDLYPSSLGSWLPVVTAQEWFAGRHVMPKFVDLRPPDMPLLYPLDGDGPAIESDSSYSSSCASNNQSATSALRAKKPSHGTMMDAITSQFTVANDGRKEQDGFEGVHPDEWGRN